MTQETVGGYGAAKGREALRGGVITFPYTGANRRLVRMLKEVVVDGEDADGAEEAGGLEL